MTQVEKNAGSKLTATQVVLARQNGYKLLSRLFLEGLTAELIPYSVQLEELTAVIPTPFNVDESAASFQNIFGFNVFPFASIFLDASGLLGGATTAAVSQHYQQGGFSVQSDADHIGHELNFLAYLCQIEYAALADGTTAVLSQIHHIQNNFIQQHFLRWLPVFTLAVQRSDDLFFAAVVDLTLSLVVDHGETVQELVIGENEAAVPNPQAAICKNILENDKTSLKEIARYLTTPAHSGIYLSRDTISALARKLSLPRGFGSRQQMLLNLIRAAAEYDLLPQLMIVLETETAVWQTAYLNQQIALPPLGQHLKPWLTCIQNTTEILGSIKIQTEKLTIVN